MKTLLAVMAHAEASEAVARHWKWWRQSGCDIVGLSPADAPCVWPEDIIVRDFGSRGRIGPNIIERFVDTFLYLPSFCSTFETPRYSHIILIEYDVVTFGPLVSNVPLACERGQNSDVHFKAATYCLPPVIATPHVMQEIGGEMKRLARRGEIERGSGDRMVGLAVQNLGMVPEQVPGCITCDFSSADPATRKDRFDHARGMIKRGQLKFCHMIKTAEELEGLVGP